MRKILRFVLIIIALPAIAFVFVLVYATRTDYKPEQQIVLKDHTNVMAVLTDSSQISMMIWNIGYAGLGKEMDFFYDGGKKVRDTKENTSLNFENIRSVIKNDSSDVSMLQEADVNSKRSYHTNQLLFLSEDLNDNDVFFGKNYDVFFVPVPINRPMGSVESGLVSFTTLKTDFVARYAFPGHYAWPKRLFMLDRCFLVMQMPVTNGKELLIINTHNEAYDNGSIRDQQMSFLKNFILKEYSKGNYVVVGGDWNQCPPDFQPHFKTDVFDSVNIKRIDTGFMPDGWKWVFDPEVPTNRRVDVTYVQGETATTVIDFFLVSPNVKPLFIKTNNLGFENSDHNPVNLTIALQ